MSLPLVNPTHSIPQSVTTLTSCPTRMLTAHTLKSRPPIIYSTSTPMSHFLAHLILAHTPSQTRATFCTTHLSALQLTPVQRLNAKRHVVFVKCSLLSFRRLRHSLSHIPEGNLVKHYNNRYKLVWRGWSLAEPFGRLSLPIDHDSRPPELFAEIACNL